MVAPALITGKNGPYSTPAMAHTPFSTSGEAALYKIAKNDFI